jgi:hypothetical protein
MKTKKRILMIILFSIGGLIVLFASAFIPTLSLRTSGMETIEGEYVTVYYETEEAAAKDVFELADAESARIAKALGFDAPQDINIYIYDQQSTFQTKKYGLIALLLDLDWYIGDNRGTNVLLTSPANPGKVHDYENIKQISIHEMVHAYNSILNKNMQLWINEGLAGYLSGQHPHLSLSQQWWPIPAIHEMRTSNPVSFSNMGGYPFSYTYVEYLNDTFGWESMISLATTNDFVTAFGKDENEIYDGWIEFLYGNYP